MQVYGSNLAHSFCLETTDHVLLQLECKLLPKPSRLLSNARKSHCNVDCCRMNVHSCNPCHSLACHHISQQYQVLDIYNCCMLKVPVVSLNAYCFVCTDTDKHICQRLWV